MKIAFLNLCHTEPELVARVAKKLTQNPKFDMYVHVDGKQELAPFQQELENFSQVYLVKNRKKVYWGGYNAIEATFEMINEALKSEKNYDYLVLLQNLDYPIKSNLYIEEFFEKYKGKEFVRGCKIAKTMDWHYGRKYRIYNERDVEFYITNKSKFKKYLRYFILALKSVKTIFFDGVIKENGETFPIYYGTAQWAITTEFAKYLCDFKETHPKFNETMKHIQFPDEEYFHTVLHNSKFKQNCIYVDEPVKRWLVNWRNIHYYEYPKEIKVFTEADFDSLIKREELFIRKVRSKESGKLIDLIDEATSK